jgi:methyl-accepting chemotaxis protein
VDYRSGDEIGELAQAFRRTIEYFKSTASVMDALSRGDLTVEQRPKSGMDRLGQAMETMIRSLRDVISRASDGAIQVASASQQVSNASQSLSQGATEQAASVEEISSTMTEIGAQTKTNAENAAQANQLSSSAKGSSDRGKEQMESTVQAMSEINQASQEIARIIKVIDDIAFQTNLLALNAAVEAARAGKHGKGFAVVAEEVRNLASRSAKAAKETADLIEASKKKVAVGLELATGTAESFKDIVAGIVKVADLVAEISAASNEQAGAVGQVTQGVTQIDRVTQQNTASAEEVASSAEELASQAEELHRLMAHFKLPGAGKAELKPKMKTDPKTDPKTDIKTGPKTEPKKVVKATPSSEPKGRSKPGTGWGGVKVGAVGGGDKAVRPEEVIALDDREFGKY